MIECAGVFDAFWAVYPRKVGKIYAKKAWDQALKRGADVATIAAVLRERMAGEWQGREKAYLPHPATFLRSEDFSPRSEEPPLLQLLPRPGHRHFCGDCRPPHEYACSTPDVWMDDCPEFGVALCPSR